MHLSSRVNKIAFNDCEMKKEHREDETRAENPSGRGFNFSTRARKFRAITLKLAAHPARLNFIDRDKYHAHAWIIYERYLRPNLSN